MIRIPVTLALCWIVCGQTMVVQAQAQTDQITETDYEFGDLPEEGVAFS